jgi:hypothetical protein
LVKSKTGVITGLNSSMPARESGIVDIVPWKADIILSAALTILSSG